MEKHVACFFCCWKTLRLMTVKGQKNNNNTTLEEIKKKCSEENDF